MSLVELAGFIERIGFPVFMCCYMVFRMDKLLREIKNELKRANYGRMINAQVPKKAN